MKCNMKKILCTLAVAATLAGGLTLNAHAADADTKKRTVTGAAVGGAVVGVATGSWGWAAVGAVAGGTGGYLYDKNKKKDEKAARDGGGDKSR